MHKWILEILACPNCRNDSPLKVTREQTVGEEIVDGVLSCQACGREWLIANGIPRFVEPGEDYAENFSYEWSRWGRVQIDRFAGHSLSRERFFYRLQMVA